MGSTLQTLSQLSAPRQGAPPSHSTLPVLRSPNTVHFPSRGGRGGGNPSPAPTPPRANAFLPGTRCPARCKRCGRRTIPRRGAHNHRPPGPAARTAGEWGAPSCPRHSRPGTPLGHPTAPRVHLLCRSPPTQPPPSPLGHTHPPPAPAHSAQGAAASLRPPPQPQRRKLPPRPPPQNPQPPHPLTAAQRPAAGGGRRPGARKRPDRGDPGRTPYLGGRRGGDGRSGSASERGGRQ